MRYLLLSLLIVGCDKPIKERPLTELQKKYVEQMSLAEKVYMEDCLKLRSDETYQREFMHCQTEMYRELIGVRHESKSNGVLNTAVGTALGIGAAHVILGK